MKAGLELVLVRGRELMSQVDQPSRRPELRFDRFLVLQSPDQVVLCFEPLFKLRFYFQHMSAERFVQPIV